MKYVTTGLILVVNPVLRQVLISKFGTHGTAALDATINCFKVPHLLPSILDNLNLGTVYGTDAQASALHRFILSVGPEEYVERIKLARWAATQDGDQKELSNTAIMRLERKMKDQACRSDEEQPLENESNENNAPAVSYKSASDPSPKNPAPQAQGGRENAHIDKPASGFISPSDTIEPKLTSPQHEVPLAEVKYINVPGYMGPERRAGTEDRRKGRDRRERLEAVNKNHRFGKDRRSDQVCRRKKN